MLARSEAAADDGVLFVPLTVLPREWQFVRAAPGGRA